MLNRLRSLLWMLLALALPLPAAAGLPGIGDADNWRLREVGWADKGTLPATSQFSSGLTAHYNMAYGTTVLGLTVREPDNNEYFAVVASLNNNLLTTLDYLGPLATAPVWQSGAYHLAAGLPDGCIVIWLTAPGEYPLPLVAARDYIPGTALGCVAYPPQQKGPMTGWQDWTATLGYQGDPDYPGLEVITIDGHGRVVAALDWLDLDNSLSQLHLREYTLGDYVIPGVLAVSGQGTYSAWYHPEWGWRAEKLGGGGLSAVRLWLSPGDRQPAGLAVFNDHGDVYDEPVVQEIRLGLNARTGLSARWGELARVSVTDTYEQTAFIDTVQLVWPVIVQSTGADIRVAYHDPDPRGKPGNFNFTGALLHSGQRGVAGTEEVALHPILSISGSAHWNTGNPSIFWVQLGGGRNFGEGALYHLEYVAVGQYDKP